MGRSRTAGSAHLSTIVFIILLTAWKIGAASEDDVLKSQSLGRIVVSGDSRYVYFEWSRPYSWSPDSRGLSKSAAQRKQTFIYEVSTTSDPLVTELLFEPRPGSTYYLGNHSPDGRRLSLYEVDRDTGVARAGVVDVSAESKPGRSVLWFETPADDSRLDQLPLWISNEEFEYPSKSTKTAWAIANVSKEEARLCKDCAAPSQTPTANLAGASSSDKSGLPENAQLAARSANGEFSVYTVDTSDILALYLKRQLLVQKVFENARVPSVIAEQTTGGYGKRRPWTPTDSVAVRYFTAHYNSWDTWPRPAAVFSPDRSRFFYLHRHGDLLCDCNETSLEVFSVPDVRAAFSSRRRSIQPAKNLRLRTRDMSENWAITDARWADSSTILFIGATRNDQRQLMSFDVVSGALKQLTETTGAVASFESKGKGITIVEKISEKAPRPGYPISELTRKGPGYLEFVATTSINLCISSWYDGGTPRRLAECAPSRRLNPWLSNSGRFAIFLEDALPETESRLLRQRSTTKPPMRFVLIDLQSGVKQSLVPAMIPKSGKSFFGQQDAVWSGDDRYVALIGAETPGSDATDVTVYDRDSDSWQTLEPPRDTAALRWANEERGFAISRTGGTAETLFVMKEGKWSASDRTVSSLHEPQEVGITVSYEESVNTPPRMRAYEGKRSILLGDEDPALAAVEWSQVRDFQWRGLDGKASQGYLLLPRGFVKGRPVPVVLQPYNYVPGRFLPDGNFPTAMAAQSLAARGMAVLTFDSVRMEGMDTVKEGPSFVAKIDAIIAALTAEGVTRPDRVGLIGFSRSGWQIHYAITHSGQVHPGAAYIADSATHDFTSYLMYGAYGYTSPPTQMLSGGKPFWQDKAAWLEHQTAFNVDRVTTPTLFLKTGEMFSDGTTLSTIGAYTLNNKPFEYLFIPTGDHNLVRPRERLASMESSVDWMSFWLQKAEDPRPDKAHRFERWRAIRAATKVPDALPAGTQ